MTLDDVLKSLFPNGHAVKRHGDIVTGHGPLKSGGDITVIGIVDGAPLSPEDVVTLGAHVLDTVEAGGGRPILVLVDTQGQLMARRAEMLGLNEYCAHLAKCLLLASHAGHRTVGLEYGQAAAGAFLATALATDVLAAVEGATPTVMDLPSIARVTKLPEKKLAEMAKTMPVFAPGLDSLFKAGAVAVIWDAGAPFDAQLAKTLEDVAANDERGALGKARGGRTVSADIASRVMAAVASGV
jgi:malonate decarboxylase gamma subunit